MKIPATSNDEEMALNRFPVASDATETLRWLTDIIAMRDNTEEPHAQRSIPRVELAYTNIVLEENVPEYNNFIYGAQRSLFALPLWHDAQKATASGATVLCNTDDYQFNFNDLVLIHRSMYAQQYARIVGIFSGEIELDENVGAGDVLLVPIKKSWLIGDVSREADRRHSNFSATYRVLEDDTAFYGFNPAQYNGYDFYSDEPSMESSTASFTLSQAQEIVDYNVGKQNFSTPWKNQQIVKAWRFVLNNRKDIVAYKKFLYRIQGRFRKFYAPLFEKAVHLASQANIVASLQIYDDDYLEYANLRKHIGFKDNAGIWHLRAITNATLLGNIVTLTLDAPLNLLPANISMISWIALHRFNSDDVQLTYHSTDLVESTIGLVELEP